MNRRRPPAARKPDVDQALRGLFKSVQVRVLPEHIRTVVDQLDAQAKVQG